MRCKCQAKAKLDVIDSRIVHDFEVRRKRVCPVCKAAYRTVETLVGEIAKHEPKPRKIKERKPSPSIIAPKPKPKKIVSLVPVSRQRKKEELDDVGWSSRSEDDDLRHLGIDFRLDDSY